MKANKVQVGDLVFCLHESKVRKVLVVLPDPAERGKIAFTWEDLWTSYYKESEDLLVYRDGVIW